MNLKYFGNSTRKATGQGVKRRYFKAGRHFFSKLEIIFCAFLAENNFVNLLIPFIGVRQYIQVFFS